MTPKGWLYTGVVVIVLGLIGYLSWELHKERQAHRDLAFRADSLAAANDTTRAVNARAQKVLGDSLRGVELRAVQLVSLKVDALDQALKRISVAKFNTSTTVRPIVDVTKTASVTVDTLKDIRSAIFLVDSTPYHVKAAVSLPAPPAQGRIGISVRTDTAHFSSRVQCGEAKAGGVRPVSVLMDGPPWLPFSISDATTEQNICNQEQAGTPLWVKALWFAAGGVAGYVAHR